MKYLTKYSIVSEGITGLNDLDNLKLALDKIPAGNYNIEKVFEKIYSSLSENRSTLTIKPDCYQELVVDESHFDMMIPNDDEKYTYIEITVLSDNQDFNYVVEFIRQFSLDRLKVVYMSFEPEFENLYDPIGLNTDVFGIIYKDKYLVKDSDGNEWVLYDFNELLSVLSDHAYTENIDFTGVKTIDEVQYILKSQLHNDNYVCVLRFSNYNL